MRNATLRKIVKSIHSNYAYYPSFESLNGLEFILHPKISLKKGRSAFPEIENFLGKFYSIFFFNI